MFARLARWLGIDRSASRPRRLQARYDAAANTAQDRQNWLHADDLAPDAAASPEVRRTLRMRGRYEQFNNPYTDGMLQTLAGDIVGICPTLQMLTRDEQVDQYIEEEFADWADAVQLGEKLRILVETRAAVGEAFAILGANPQLPTPVKLDATLLEPDQVATPQLGLIDDDRHVDGIVYDRWNNPREYHVLRQHPGDTRFLTVGPWDYQRIPAADMLHLYKVRRPGQRRGIPQITSSLPLFAERRGMRRAVLAAARKAAEMGAVMLETDAPADPDEADNPDAFDTLEIDPGMMTVLPGGAKAKQLEPTQPATTYREWDDKLINEQARPLNMPFNIAACNSSEYNYASGRLDHQTNDRAIEIDHREGELKLLNRILARWLQEALLIPGYMYARTGALTSRRLPHQWLWRPRPHVDPQKEADSQRTRLESLTATLTEELARQGKDLESHLATLARERALLRQYGLSMPTTTTPAPAAPEPDDEEPAQPARQRSVAGRNGHGRLGGRS